MPVATNFSFKLPYRTICVQWPQFPVQTCKIPELACPRRPHSNGAGCGTKMKAGGKQGTALWAAECYRLYFYACLHFFGEPKVNIAHVKWWAYGCLSATAALQSLSKSWKHRSHQPSWNPRVVGGGRVGSKTEWREKKLLPTSIKEKGKCSGRRGICTAGKETGIPKSYVKWCKEHFSQ